MIPTPDRLHLAAFLDLRGKAGLVVGGGEVGARKAETLMRSGLQVTVVAPDLCGRLAQWRDAGALRHLARRFEPGDLDGVEIAIAATDDAAVNAAVGEGARARRIPVDVADDPSASTFIMPAVVDRSPVQIAISTGGASPVLARRLAALVEAAIPFAYGRLAALAAAFRAAARRRYPDASTRRRFWERAINGPVADKVLAGRDAEARDLLERELHSGNNSRQTGERLP